MVSHIADTELSMAGKLALAICALTNYNIIILKNRYHNLSVMCTHYDDIDFVYSFMQAIIQIGDLF